MYREYGNLKEILEFFFQIFSDYSSQKIIEICNMKFPNFTKVNNHTNKKRLDIYS